MGIVVQKYGGSSVADAVGIKRVAQRIVATKKAGHDVVVVVSAMGDTTDELIDLANDVSPLPPGRELDMLLTAGERISMALLAMAIGTLGQEARSFTGSQAGVITDSEHGRAKIIDVTPGRLQAAIAEGAVAIVAGFQGVSQTTKDITTLGRGGSDTTAAALAAALGADVCEIYSDVDGIFTADPRIVPNARQIPRISYEEALEMTANGAKILHLRCVEYARRNDIPIHVRSSFSDRPGTWVVSSEDVRKDPSMEQAIISGVAHDRSEAKVTVVGVPDKVGEAAAIFRALADAQINIDMIVQNVSAAATALTDISFTLPRSDGQTAMTALARLKDEIGFERLQYDDSVGKVSIVGAGMRSSPGITATFFQALADAGVNIEMISTSEIRISVVVNENQVDAAVEAAHEAFELGSDEVEAVVYGGTGREWVVGATGKTPHGVSAPPLRSPADNSAGRHEEYVAGRRRRRCDGTGGHRHAAAPRRAGLPGRRGAVLRVLTLGRQDAALEGRRDRRRGRRDRRPVRARHRAVLRRCHHVARARAAVRGGRRHRHRQLVGVPQGSGHSADRQRGQSR